MLATYRPPATKIRVEEGEADWRNAKILQPQKAYVIEYPQAEEFMDQQMSIFWLPDEIDVTKDLQDLRVNISDSQRHGIITVLKLFVQYELFVGSEYWNNVVAQSFQRPEIQAMASTFGFFELAVHARFYNKINEVLNLNTEEFYLAYKEDETLNQRMVFIEKYLDTDDLPLSLAVFSLLESVVLYSSFAYMKSFQALGQNFLKNTASGISFSLKDEHIHSMAGAWLFRTVMQESGANLRPYQIKMEEICGEAYEHEARIIDMIFEKGEQPGIDADDMKQFVKHRINLCLQNLGLEPMFDDETNTIGDWFYEGINSMKFHDFFAAAGNEYRRDYSETRFVW